MKNDIYKKNDTVYSAEINGRTVAMNMETGEFYNLDEVGSLIWRLLEKSSTVNDVISGVSDECEISFSECKDDVIFFIDSLCTNNLITKISEV